MTKVDNVIKEIEKTFGKGSIAKVAKAKAIYYERLSTGLIQLDFVLNGGIPMGRIIEFSGPFSSGKTAISLKIATEFQKRGKQVAFVDAEHSFDQAFAQKIGIDLDNMYIVQPEAQEDAIDIMEMLIKSKDFGLVILDSITGLIPLRVLGKSSEDMTIGIEAKLNNLFMRKIVSSFAPGNLLEEKNRPWCSLIMINQLRAKMSMYGNDEPGGGYGIKFFKSVAIEFRRTANLGKDGEEIKERDKEKYGQTIAFVVRKNKTGIPMGVGSTDFYYKDASSYQAGEFDVVKDIIGLALKFGFIERSGPRYEIKLDDEIVSALGKFELFEKVRNNDTILNYLKNQVMENI